MKTAYRPYSFIAPLLTLWLLLPLGQAHAEDYTPPPACERTPKDIRALARNKDFRLSFDNDGGILNQGVCWWHARFQRAAWYLAEFQPEFPKPSYERAKKIINGIANRSGFVSIPGYSNFKAFSKDFSYLIQERLDEWQMKDATLGFAWIDGLEGETSLPSGELLRTMDEIYERVVKQGEIGVIKLQVPGLSSHAWIIVNMIKAPSKGYDLEIVDSNYGSKTYIIPYRFGDETIRQVYLSSRRFVPALMYEDDLEQINDIKRRNCR